MLHRLLLAVLIYATMTAANATAIKESSWLPMAAAYRSTLFIGNLSPLPWAKLQANWQQAALGAEPSRPAFSYMSQNQRQRIQAALKNKNRQALFSTSTRVQISSN